MLTQFAMMAMALLGILALVVDVGQARLAREQMQRGADSAAIEAVRFRNVGRVVTDESADGFVSDCMRRASARNLVTWTFDDDFDTGADALRLGAGANPSLAGGDPTVNAGQTIVDVGVFDPAIETNQGFNAAHGDIVSGTFAYTPGPELNEDDSYTRVDGSVPPATDFTPGLPVATGTSGLTGCPADDATSRLPDFTGIASSGSASVQDEAVLVRLRRTVSPRAARNNPLDTEPGTSSSGPTLPLLFARGAAMPVADTDESIYSPRHDGLSVRATAIARVAPARRVGPSSALLPGMGATTFVLNASCWNLATWGTTPLGSSNADEVWAAIDAHALVTGHEAWTLRTSTCTQAGVLVPNSAWRIGQTPAPATFAPGTIQPLDDDGYAPVYAPITGAGGPTDRVVAFGRATLAGIAAAGLGCNPGTSSDTGCLRLVRRNVSSNQPRVAPWNASATLPDGFPSSLTRAEIEAVVDAAATIRAALLAPVLAR